MNMQDVREYFSHEPIMRNLLLVNKFRQLKDWKCISIMTASKQSIYIFPYK